MEATETGYYEEFDVSHGNDAYVIVHKNGMTYIHDDADPFLILVGHVDAETVKHAISGYKRGYQLGREWGRREKAREINQALREE